MISMTTDSVLPRERAEFWTDLVSRHVTPMCIEPAGEQPLSGEVQVRVIGDLGVAQVSGRGVHASHTRVQIARTRGHLYAACVHLDGEARISRRGEQIALQKGDVFITDSRHEFTLDLERPWRHLLITLPTQWIDGRVTRPDLLSGAVLHGHPLARLWASHLASGFMLSGDLSPTAGTLFARHSVDLLAQLLEEAHCDQPTPSDAVRAAIFLNACHVITLKFGDPAPDASSDSAGTEGIDTHAGTDFRCQQRDRHAAFIRRTRPSGCKAPDQRRTQFTGQSLKLPLPVASMTPRILDVSLPRRCI